MTRRQALKATVAAAALTLPLGRLRSTAALAAGTAGGDCQKGCAFTADKAFGTARSRCNYSLYANATGMLLNPLVYLASVTQAHECLDRAILTNKAKLYDCLQPGCPGFDPKGPDGPCETCKDNCCPCQASDTGYICCVFPCNDPNNHCCPGG